MDPFEVLCLGTSLEKSRSLKHSYLKKDIPSAGSVAHPQIYPEVSFTSGQMPEEIADITSGRKRVPDAVGIYPEDLTVSERSSKKLKGSGFDSNDEHPDPKAHALKTSIDIGEEESRRIMKLHKVAVTLFGPEHQVEAFKMRRDRGHSSGRSSEKRALRLYPIPLRSLQDLGPRFGLSRRLGDNIVSQKYSIPTEVQLGSIPLLLGTDLDRGLQGKGHDHTLRSDIDLLAVAPTGSGKTLAFLIPIIQHFINENLSLNVSGRKRSKKVVRAIVLVPTHELVDQIVREAKNLTAGTAVKVAAMQKGYCPHQSPGQNNAVSNVGRRVIKTDILVGTPMTIVNCMSTGINSEENGLPDIKYLVLDEADTLLDESFIIQTLKVWDACTSTRLSVSLWSATISSSQEAFIKKQIVERRQRLGLPLEDHFILRLVVGLKDTALPVISHRLVYTATERGKLLALREIFRPSKPETKPESTTDAPALRPPFLVFTQTITRAIALHSELLFDVPAEAGGSSRIAVFHSDLPSATRANVINGFRKADIWVLITTDLLCRGIDFRGVNGVVNFDIPNTGSAYVHRAGRTGRAGREGGIAITLYTNEDIPYVRNIANSVASSERFQGIEPGSSRSSLPKWLLDALPTLSKRTKQSLKKGGVPVRRDVKQKDGGRKGARRARISTNSGFDRQKENKRNKRFQNQRQASRNSVEWQGIKDA